jgi:hypothetical protein
MILDYIQPCNILSIFVFVLRNIVGISKLLVIRNVVFFSNLIYFFYFIHP